MPKTTSTNLGRVSLVPRGAYNPATEYHWLDIVQYGGSSFLVLREALVGITPSDGVNYMLVAEKGGPGTQGPQGVQGATGDPGPSGPPGPSGSSIQSIARTEGNGAPGTTDTYTITLTDGTTTTFQVYNGKDGAGSGDMTSDVYDPQGKKQDIFKYIDDHTQKNAVTVQDGGTIIPPQLSSESTGPWEFEFTPDEEDVTPERIGAAPKLHAAQHAEDGADPVTLSIDQIAGLRNVLSNPNLLLNWDFRNPVNRNGKVEYTAAETSRLTYCFDMWSIVKSTLKTKDGYLNLKTDTVAAYKRMIQPTTRHLQAGHTYTLSLLARVNAVSGSAVLRPSNSTYGVISSASGKQLNQSAEWNIVAYSFIPNEDVLDCCADLLVSDVQGGWIDIDIIAWKLELGDHQTLARQNADGEWEIIDPPDYDLQYALCSQYSPITGEWIGNQHSNPNLLENWYFVGGGSQQGGGQFPINQRGKTEYTGIGYSIDRWGLNVNRGKITVSDDCITLTNTTDSGAEYLRQGLEHEFRTGDILTLSFLIRGNAQGQVFFGSQESGANIGAGTKAFTANAEWQLVSVTVTLGSTLPGWAVIQITGKNSYIDILAAKLELGPVQTLAHKEGDTWVLNDPPPNYQQELAKCQRYQFKVEAYSGRYAGSSRENVNTVQMFIPVPVTPRANPSYPNGSILLNVFSSSGAYSNVSCSIISALSIGNGVLLTLTSDSALSGGTYRECVISLLSPVLLDFNL